MVGSPICTCRSHAPVPEDRLGGQHGLTEKLAALWACIETHPTIGDTLLLGSTASLHEGVSDGTATQNISDLGVLVKLVSGDVVDRENELDIVGVCLFDESSNLFRAVLVEKGVSDLFR